MGSVSAVEFVNYMPSIVVSENLTSYAAVEARIASDTDGIANLLHTYLNVAKPDRTYAVNLTDKTKQELYKLDIDLLQSANNVGYPVPDNGGEVKIRPFIEFSRLQSVLTIVDSDLQSVRDFEVGRSVHLIDGARFVKAKLTSVDVVAGTITVDVALVDAKINIVGFVSVDPGRMVDVINFRDWVADEASNTSSTSLQGFNPELYKLLYGEIDEDLVHMTDEELADNYLSNPTRIGSVSDLKRAVQSQNIVSAEVTNTLSLGPSAQVLFDDGSSLRGMFRSSLVADPKTTIESFDNLSVTPAALLAVIARELKDAFESVSVSTLEASGNVSIIGNVDVQGEATFQTVKVNTDAHVLGNLSIDTDVKVSGDTILKGVVSVVGDLTATVVEASDVFVDGALRTVGSITANGGAEVNGGFLVDTLTATDQIDARGGLDVTGDLDTDILNVRNVATVPILFADTIQTSAMKSSVLHSDSVEITADLTVSTVSGIDQTFSTADIARVTAIDVITSNAQVESAHVMHLTTPVAEITSLDTTDINASTIVATDKIVSHNEISSETGLFGTVRASNIVDTPSVIAHNVSTTDLDAATGAVNSLNSVKINTSSFRTDTLEASGTIDAHTIRTSNAIETPTITSCLATISELSVLDVATRRIDVTDSAKFAGPIESVSIQSESISVIDGSFTSLASNSLSASNVITDKITSSEAYLNFLETGSLATTTLVSNTVNTGAVNVSNIDCDIGAVRDLTSTSFNTLTVKAQSIDSVDSRVVSLISDDISTRDITIANNVVCHGDVRSQSLNVVSTRVGTLDGDRISAAEIHSVTVASDHLHSNTVEAAHISSKALNVSQVLDVSGDVRFGGRLDVSQELNVPVARIQSCVVSDFNGGQIHANTVDASDIRSVGVTSANVQASSVVTDRLSVNTIEVTDVNTHGIVSREIENSATIRTGDLHVSNSIASNTVDIAQTLRCGVVTVDDSAVTVASGTLDAQSAYAKFGDTESTSLTTERVTTIDGDITNLRTVNAIVNSIEVEEVSIPGKLTVDGTSTFMGDITTEKLTTQHHTVQNLDVAQNSTLSGTVDFNMTSLTLPESVYCKSNLDVQTEVATTTVSSNTLVVSRIVIGPAGMTFV